MKLKAFFLQGLMYVATMVDHSQAKVVWPIGDLNSLFQHIIYANVRHLYDIDKPKQNGFEIQLKR